MFAKMELAILNVLLFFITLFSGALAMSALENWNFTDSVYWVRDLIIFFSSIFTLFFHLFVYFILFTIVHFYLFSRWHSFIFERSDN